MLPRVHGCMVSGSKTVHRSKRPIAGTRKPYGIAIVAEHPRNPLTTRGAWRRCGHGLANLSRRRAGRL